MLSTYHRYRTAFVLQQRVVASRIPHTIFEKGHNPPPAPKWSKYIYKRKASSLQNKFANYV